MKIILVKLIRIVVFVLSIIVIGFCVTYIVNPQYTGQQYNYDIRLFGRLLGTSIPIIISILGIFPYKILKKGIFRMIFTILLFFMSLLASGIYFYSYYSTGGRDFPVIYFIATLILFANLWAFYVICRMNDLKKIQSESGN